MSKTQQVKKVLKVKIHQPEAHYRVPFSYQRRFTYPIPPYSTVKGLICNILGIKNDNDEKFKRLKEGLSLAIYGQYESMIKEYIWFRNLAANKHKRFYTVENRVIDKTPAHPGIQMPVIIDVLHNVNITMYIHHPNEEFLADIYNAFKNPVTRTSPLHLGRAEDWVVINPEEVNLTELTPKRVFHIKYFAWIPEENSVDENFILDMDRYKKFFEKVNGNVFKLPTFYEINSENQRVFNEYVKVKLYEGGSFEGFEFYIDEHEEIPVIFCKLKRSGNG